MELNLDILKEWIIALRSGEYQQTKATLQDANGYCCLGVACRIFIPQNQLNLLDNGMLSGLYPDRQLHCPEWLKEEVIAAEKKPNIAWEYIKAVKNKVCPIITWK